MNLDSLENKDLEDPQDLLASVVSQVAQDLSERLALEVLLDSLDHEDLLV